MSPYWQGFVQGFVQGFKEGLAGVAWWWVKAYFVGAIILGGIWSVFGFNLWTFLLSQIVVLVVWTKMWLNFEEPPND